ncbi:MAG: hypothetical protein M1132_08555 [Chloroflexi bacterium]|nr:hypothetical protein [Chloroflexota bacterium]
MGFPKQTDFMPPPNQDDCREREVEPRENHANGFDGDGKLDQEQNQQGDRVPQAKPLAQK